MIKYLENLCEICGTSGDEGRVRDFIISKLPNDCDYSVDALGNLIIHKHGLKKPKKLVMLDAHMDEVGVIITGITADGFLRFMTVGGIDSSCLVARKVVINDTLSGIICTKPIHLCTSEERKTKHKIDDLVIDIGAYDYDDAQKAVSVGDFGVFENRFVNESGKIISKALDDRVGCAILLDIINNYNEYDYYTVFSVLEEVGLRGAKTAAYSISPDYAIVLEATTAADVDGVPDEKHVTELGRGAAISYMDRATVYDSALYKYALDQASQKGIACQLKTLPSGGNNSGSIHLTRSGVKVVSLSVPCRYIHSASCVSCDKDIISVRELGELLLSKLASGEYDDN